MYKSQFWSNSVLRSLRIVVQIDSQSQFWSNSVLRSLRILVQIDSPSKFWSNSGLRLLISLGKTQRRGKQKPTKVYIIMHTLVGFTLFATLSFRRGNQHSGQAFWAETCEIHLKRRSVWRFSKQEIQKMRQSAEKLYEMVWKWCRNARKKHFYIIFYFFKNKYPFKAIDLEGPSKKKVLKF